MDQDGRAGQASFDSGDALSDLGAPSADVRARGALAAVGYGLGGIGLFGATAADALAVAGRHLGFRLLGSIELVQAMVVLLGAAAMLIATLTASHAGVHIVTERLRPATAARLARVAALASGVAMLALAFGSAWVAVDMWNGFEQTELLNIPLRWLRLLWIAVALVIAARFLRNAVKAPVS
ncbi:MAG: TRAP transporter small permease subunit [Sphingomonadales bacterium]|nr:TRAP transporter small permease subunit [Sphingomonadales bacterium]